MDARTAEVLEVLRARGALSKEDIDGTWGFDPGEYAALKREVLAQRDIVSGPRRVGGFLVKARGGSPPEEPAPPPTPIPGPDWQAASVARLCELFQHKDLEGLLGSGLVYTVRLARRVATGIDRRGTKEELAHALVIKHEIDLFVDQDVRAAVAAKSKLTNPGRWVPGKAAAVDFVKNASFPPELAGIPTEDPPKDFEYLEGRVDLRRLQDFQEEVKRQVLYTLDTPKGRAIVTLPTGAGKTRVAVESIKDWLTSRFNGAPGKKGSTVLWLAHSGELCEQAYTEFRQVWQASSAVCPLLLFRFWARFMGDLAQHREVLGDILTRPTVLVSTPQRIVNLIEDSDRTAAEVLRDVAATTCLIVIDEAHRAAARSYDDILTYFHAMAPAVPPLIGLTATPFRREYHTDRDAGTVDLRDVFLHLIEARETLGENPREKLQERKVLARPVVETVKTTTVLESPIKDPESLTEDQIEQIDHALGLRADNPQRRLAVLKHILPACRNPSNSILYFGPSISDAECMAFLLKQEGISAAVVSGNTRDVTRRKIVADFKNGRVRVLCNCEVLTTGFDAPRVTHVVVARPTVSGVLYEQMVGRGLRGPVFGGTEDCVIVDCDDHYKSKRPELGYQAFRHIWAPTMRKS